MKGNSAAGTVVSGCLAGLAGTSVMTATTWLEQRCRPHLDHPVDYDASAAPVHAASKVLGVHPGTPAQRRALFALVHWGYGSLVGVGHAAAARRVGSPTRGTVLFYGGVQGMAFALLPSLGGTPAPWRWSRDVLVSSVVQHAVYAVTVGWAERRVSGPLSRRCS